MSAEAAKLNTNDIRFYHNTYLNLYSFINFRVKYFLSSTYVICNFHLIYIKQEALPTESTKI
jgi:hypothetical protein